MNRQQQIKVCGVNDLEFARTAERLGADYLGFIFAPESPRQVTAAFVIATRRQLLGKSRCVGVFTTTSIPEIIVKCRVCGLKIVQLHRRASVREVAELRTSGFEVWTLAGGAEGDAVIFDSSHGDGERKLRKGDYKAVLAGGIAAEKVAEALASPADIIDVSGSLESSLGVKSTARLKYFFKCYNSITKGRIKC